MLTNRKVFFYSDPLLRRNSAIAEQRAQLSIMHDFAWLFSHILNRTYIAIMFLICLFSVFTINPEHTLSFPLISRCLLLQLRTLIIQFYQYTYKWKTNLNSLIKIFYSFWYILVYLFGTYSIANIRRSFHLLIWAYSIVIQTRNMFHFHHVYRSSFETFVLGVFAAR